MITITPITEEVRVHTGVSKQLKNKINMLAKKLNLPQSLIINSALEIGLKNIKKV